MRIKKRASRWGSKKNLNTSIITGINPEAVKLGVDRYDRLLCPGLQPGPPSQTPGGLGQRYWSVSEVMWPPQLELRRWRSSGSSSVMSVRAPCLALSMFWWWRYNQLYSALWGMAIVTQACEKWYRMVLFVVIFKTSHVRILNFLFLESLTSIYLQFHINCCTYCSYTE